MKTYGVLRFIFTIDESQRVTFFLCQVIPNMPLLQRPFRAKFKDERAVPSIAF